MSSSKPETQSDATTSFLSHFTSSPIGGQVHPALESCDDQITGLSMFSKTPIPADERLITCPASWVITPEICREAIVHVVGTDVKGKAKEVDDGMGNWKETMLICGYICLHWIYHDRGEWVIFLSGLVLEADILDCLKCSSIGYMLHHSLRPILCVHHSNLRNPKWPFSKVRIFTEQL